MPLSFVPRPDPPISTSLPQSKRQSVKTRPAAWTASPLVQAALGKFPFRCLLLLSQPLTTRAREPQKSPMHHWLKLSPSLTLRVAHRAPPKHAGRCEDQDCYQHVIRPSYLPKEMRYVSWRQSWWKGNRMPATQPGKLPSYAPQKHAFLPTFPLPKVSCTETVPDIAPVSSFILRWLRGK